MVCISVIGTLFTAHTACRISFEKLSVPARGLRIKNAVEFEDRRGQYTVEGAFLSEPSWRMSPATPITSLQASVGFVRICLPIAAWADPQYSRAKFSAIRTTFRFS